MRWDSRLRKSIPGLESDCYEFRLELQYEHLLPEEDRRWLTLLGEELSPAEALALVHARHDGYVDNQTLRGITGQHPADITKVLSGLSNRGQLRMRGAGRGAYYEPALDNLSPDSLVDASSTSGLGELESELADLWPDLEAIAEPVRSTQRAVPELRDSVLVRLCSITPLSIPDMEKLLGRKKTGLRAPIQELVESGRLGYLYPENPQHPKQRYVAAELPRVEQDTVE